MSMFQYTSTWPGAFSTLFAAVVTAGSITAPVATITEPAGDGIFAMNASPVPFNSAAIAFFGGTAADDTFTARITGWRKITVAGNTLWIPTPLLALDGILGAMTGVASQAVTNSQLFADTLTASTAFTTAYEIINPAADQVAIVKVDAFGCEKIQVQVAKNTCTNISALAAGF